MIHPMDNLNICAKYVYLFQLKPELFMSYRHYRKSQQRSPKTSPFAGHEYVSTALLLTLCFTNGLPAGQRTVSHLDERLSCIPLYSIGLARFQSAAKWWPL